MPKGTRQPDGSRKVAVRFPEELFNALCERAWSDKKSFSTTVCEMAELGLFDLEELEASEEAA